MGNSTATAVDFFTGRGWTKQQAAGIVGNLMGESNLDPNAVGDDGLARGIGQWHSDRWAGLQKFAASTGSAPSDLMTQLAYVDHELRTTERHAGDALRRAATVDEATAAAIGFERPAGWTAANPRAGHNFKGRLTFAQEAFGGGGDGSVSLTDGRPNLHETERGPLLSESNPYDTTPLNADTPLTAQQVVAQANAPAGPETPYASLFETAKAAASSDWPTVWAWRRATEGAVDPDWTGPTQQEWEQTMKDVPEEYHDYLLGAGSEDAFLGRIRIAQEDMETQSRLAHTSWSSAARMVVDMFDPLTLAASILTDGLGGALLRSVELGSAARAVAASRPLRIATRALESGTSNAALEAGIGETTDDPHSDPLMAFGIGAVLGGVLGGIAKNPATAWEAGELHKIGRASLDQTKAGGTIDPETIYIPGGRGNAGAARSGKPVSDWILDDRHVPEAAFGKVRFDVTGQMTTSPEPRTRLMGYLLGEEVVGRKDRGVIDDPLTVIQKAHAMRRWAPVEKVVGPARASWFEETGVNRWNPLARGEASDEFNRLVWEAVWSPETDPVTSPHVLKAAEAYRAFYDTYRKDITNPRWESGGYAEPLADVKPNPNYVPLYANHAKVADIASKVDEDVMEAFLVRAIQSHTPTINDKLAKRMARGYWRNLRRAGYGVEDRTDLAVSTGDREMFKQAYREADPSYGDDELDEMFDTLTGIAENGVASEAGKVARLKRRTLLDYSFAATLEGHGKLRVRDMFVKDMEFITRRYNRTMSGRVALAQAQVRNPVTGDLFMDGIRTEADFDKLKNWVREGWQEKSGDYQKNRKAMENAIANMEHMHSAIVGKPLYGSETELAQWLRRIKAFQFIRLMNNMGLNQAQETWKIVGTLGAKAAFRQLPAIRRMVDASGRSQPARDALLAELEDVTGFGLEGMFGRYDFALMEDRIAAAESGRMGGRIDTMLDFGSRVTADISLMRALLTYQERWAVKAISQRLYDIAKATTVVEGDNLTFDLSRLGGRERERLAAAGIGEDEAKLVFGQMLRHGVTDGDRLTALGAAKWDPAALVKFTRTMNRFANRIVQQNDAGALAKFMSQPLAQLFTQFRAFVLGAWGKSTLYGIHHFDPQTFVLMLGELAFGMATYALRSSVQLTTDEGHDRFWEKTMDPVNLIENGFARTASASIIPMVADTALMFAGVSPQFGSARASGQPTDAVFGSPAGSSVNDLATFTGGIVGSMAEDREMKASELRAGLRSLPFANWLPLVGLFETMIDGR
ncbi:MAG: phage tail tip lysozyme [Pararhizobium sp.]